MCLNAQVRYCADRFAPAFIANVNNPPNTQTFSEAALRPVDGNGDPVTQCGSNLLATCTNEVGSFCCGLTQGAYGAPNSVATALAGVSYGDCDPDNPGFPVPGSGFLPAAACLGCDAFAGDPNGTTIGIHGTRAVTIDNLNTLIAYLPTGGTANNFKASLVGADTHYATPSAIPDLNKTTGGTKGEGAGVLAGQTMACSLNSFLSACSPPFGGSGTFTASGFGGFTLPAAGTLVCTKRSGNDKVLGTGDDICQAFSYPNCAAGLTVTQVQACANQLLAGQVNSCGCSASDLNVALSNINLEFDQCGNVIDCGSVTSPGVFTCP